MLVRLEHKGYLRHREEGKRYIYSATTAPAAAKRAALRQYLRTFFGGSLSDMMTALVRQESWTDEELDALRAEIDRARQDGKRP
jgi:BlaI family penicillinase repressor